MFSSSRQMNQMNNMFRAMQRAATREWDPSAVLASDVYPVERLSREWEPLSTGIPHTMPLLGMQSANPDSPQVCLDLISKPNEYLLTAEVPGCSKANCKVRVDGDLLTISGDKPRVVSENDATVQYRRAESGWGPFSRTVQLPSDCDTSKVTCHYDAGLLHITMGKKAVAAPKGKEIVIA